MKFLKAMAEIYTEPKVWDELDNYPQYVRDIIYIIDYDTELQMEGFSGFFENITRARFKKTYNALNNCTVVNEADILKKAKRIALSWDCDRQYDSLERKTALHNDYNEFWKLIRKYIEKIKQKLQPKG